MGESDGKTIVSPFAGGRMGKCGEVLSAEYVLEQIYKEDAAEKIEEFEDKFKASDKGSVMCSDLRGKVVCYCRACVRDAAKILEEMI